MMMDNIDERLANHLAKSLRPDAFAKVQEDGDEHWIWIMYRVRKGPLAGEEFIAKTIPGWFTRSIDLQAVWIWPLLYSVSVFFSEGIAVAYARRSQTSRVFGSQSAVLSEALAQACLEALEDSND